MERSSLTMVLKVKYFLNITNVRDGYEIFMKRNICNIIMKRNTHFLLLILTCSIMAIKASNDENDDEEEESILTDIILGILAAIFEALWYQLGAAIYNMEPGSAQLIAQCFYVFVSISIILCAIYACLTRKKKFDHHDVVTATAALITRGTL